MNQPKPIEKWKFDLQIAIAFACVIIFCLRGILFILWEPGNRPLSFFNSSLWFVTTLLGIAQFGFQAILFRSIPIIRNLLIVLIALIVLAIPMAVIRRILPFNLDLFQFLNIFHEFHRTATTIIAVAISINFLRKKFDAFPMVKMLRPYAIACICIQVITFLLPFPWFLEMFPASRAILNWERGINYFLLAVPDVFLIGGYLAIKSRIAEV